MLQLFNKIRLCIIYLFKFSQYLFYQFLAYQTWQIIPRILLLINIVFLLFLIISNQYYTNHIIQKYNLNYVPPAPEPDKTPAYITKTKKALNIKNNITYYKDIFITLSKLNNIYVILQHINHNKDTLTLKLSSKNQEGLHQYIDSLQRYLPQHMTIKKIDYDNLRVKMKPKKKKKKKKKRLNSFQKFMLKKGNMGNISKGKEASNNSIKYDYSCEIILKLLK